MTAWIPCEADLPDSDTTVVVHCPDPDADGGHVHIDPVPLPITRWHQPS